MVDWKKRIQENRQRKQQERENNKQKEKERKTATEANHKKAISFISDKAVPAFERAKKALEGDELKMRACYSPSENGTSIEMEVWKKEITREKPQKFLYCVEMEYTSSTVTPYAVCSPRNKHKIEKTNNDSAIPKMTSELLNITVDDIYNDIMKCFSNFDDEH